MDYRKIIIYAIMILVAVGIWYKSRADGNRREAENDRFASVYASTAVMAELYRNEPERFFRARDSIYTEYGVSADWVDSFRIAQEGYEERWAGIWTIVRHKTDSLVDYFKANPVEHLPADTSDTIADSISSR